MNQDIYTTQELAELLGCATTTIEERARTGELPGLKFGDGGWVFPRLATVDALNERARIEAAFRADAASSSPRPVRLGGRPVLDPPVTALTEHAVARFSRSRPPVLWSQS
jgi:excisionase family DNA binding protein